MRLDKPEDAARVRGIIRGTEPVSNNPLFVEDMPQLHPQVPEGSVPDLSGAEGLGHRGHPPRSGKG